MKSRWHANQAELARKVQSWLSVFLMEDQNMTVGELPSAHGFIVFDVVEVAALFGTTPGQGVRQLEGAHDGRLTQIEVGAGVLRNVTTARIGQALEFVVKRTRSEIEKLRQADQRTFRAGRLHAYFSMLHMNAALARAAYA